MNAPAPKAPVDLAALGQVVHEDILRLRAEEQEIIRRESEIQTKLARRRRQELFGDRKWSLAASTPAATERVSPKPTNVKANPKRNTPRVPRPGLAKRVEETWETNEGQELILGLSMRKLKLRFGVKSHSSFYEIPLFVETIQPLRERLRLERQAANYVERNARARP
jgi:hypothetical protein